MWKATLSVKLVNDSRGSAARCAEKLCFFEIYGEETMMQKVSYVHLNPVRVGLVQHPDDYLFSSARQWHGKAIDDEPLVTDQRKIKWRSAA